MKNQKGLVLSKSNGFTLVELLVVITILAILSTIGLVMYSSAQKSARIAKRISDLKAIQTALEVYYSVNKSYPMGGGGECTNDGSKTPADVIPGLTPKYLVAMPADPSMNKTANTSCYIYYSAVDGTNYKFLDHNITEFTPADYRSQRNLLDPTKDGGTDRCVVEETGNPWAWAIYSEGARCW